MQEDQTFLPNWLNTFPRMLDGYVYSVDNRLNPVRPIFFSLKNDILNWLQGKFSEKIILLPGLRGVGKTTLLSQIYNLDKFSGEDETDLWRKVENKIYIAADRLSVNSLTLNNFFESYEKYLGFSFENLKEKTLILIDEAHYDEHWGLFLKTLYDRTHGKNNILCLATGSSALFLQTNSDLARRSITRKIFPLDFPEYLNLKYGLNIGEDLRKEIRHGLFNQSSAHKVYSSLKSLEKPLNKILSGIPEKQEIVIDRYFKIGAFPFGTREKENIVIAQEKIKSIIEKIASADILAMDKFDSTTLLKIPTIIYLLANSQEANLSKIGSALGLHTETLKNVLATLEKTELIAKFASLGGAYSQARKPLKYLFLAPSVRSSILGQDTETVKGQLLEDYSALIFAKNLVSFAGPRFFYDSARGGADFIIKFVDNRKIVIEVGFNKQEIDQINLTAKKVMPGYSLLVGSGKLDIINSSIVKIPLCYWMVI